MSEEGTSLEQNFSGYYSIHWCLNTYAPVSVHHCLRVLLVRRCSAVRRPHNALPHQTDSAQTCMTGK